MQAITASQTVSAPKVAVRHLSARRTTKALASRCACDNSIGLPPADL